MSVLYLFVKWLHIFSAIVAVGANITYGVWIGRASRDRAVLPFALRTVKFIDDRIANPAYGALLITGLGMTYLAGYPLRTPWLFVSLVLYAIVFAVAFFGYTPTLKRQIEILDREGIESTRYRALASRGRMLGGILGLLVTIITLLMVMKPW